MESTRRDFLKQSTATMLTAAGVGAIGKEIFAPTYVYGARNLPERDSGPTLVVIYLRGGSDPLSVFVPFDDRTYYQMRPTISILPNDALHINNRTFRLNPAMAPLLPMINAGEIAPIINVGSPNDTRSHFDAQDFMERAAPGIKSISEGWLNRYLEQTKTQTDPELRALAIQPLLPRSLRGQYPVLAAPARKSNRHERAMAVFEELYGCDEDRKMHRAAKAAEMQADTRRPGRRKKSRKEPEPPPIDEAAQRQRIVSAGSNTIRRLRELRRIIEESPDTHVQYPPDLGEKLQAVAKVIRANVGLEIAAVDYGNWDHHIRQGGSGGVMAPMLANLSKSIAAFYKDLGNRRHMVCTLVMSEFGRTVKENGNRGSDHGRGGYMLVIGEMVNGNRMYGRWTGLDVANLADGRDLPVYTDFRLVFAEVLVKLFGYDPPDARAVNDMFPGWNNRGRSLGLLKQL
ncbi:MAG: DUF1501 domain-containing protein [Planctomycetes bacterium]|nr:DUF1501 domain-containing protein [Planctomycetota bacterium]